MPVDDDSVQGRLTSGTSLDMCHSLGLFNSLLGHALCKAIPESTATFTTIFSADVKPHVGCDVVLQDTLSKPVRKPKSGLRIFMSRLSS